MVFLKLVEVTFILFRVRYLFSRIILCQNTKIDIQIHRYAKIDIKIQMF